MIRQRLLPGRLNSKSFNRSVVSIPQLTQFNNVNHIPFFLSKKAFDLSWFQYQTMIVAKLQRMVAGSSWERKDPKDIAINFARDPERASLFNYASMAHNNHFFYQSISYEQTSPDKMHLKLRELLIRSFGSVETFKLEMVKTANAMFGPGFVWLIKDFENNFTVLATYLAGSPYPMAHFRQQTVPPSISDSKLIESTPQGLSEELKGKYTGQVVNQVGAFGPHSKPLRIPPGAPHSLTPVLCINLWDHVYLPDYGLRPEVSGGKPRYIENWWNKIDWRVVAYRALGGKSEFVR